MEIFNKIS